MNDLVLSETKFISTQQQHNSQLWYACLELGFAYQVQSNRTVLQHRKHHGPVRVQKMLWPERPSEVNILFLQGHSDRHLHSLIPSAC